MKPAVTKREFTIENEYVYNRTGPVRWIVSHVLRYPLLPSAMVVMAILNNLAYSYIQVFSFPAACRVLPSFDLDYLQSEQPFFSSKATR